MKKTEIAALLAIYAQENEIAREKDTDVKILGAVEFAHLIGVIDDLEFELLREKYLKRAVAM